MKNLHIVEKNSIEKTTFEKCILAICYSVGHVNFSIAKTISKRFVTTENYFLKQKSIFLSKFNILGKLQFMFKVV